MCAKKFKHCNHLNNMQVMEIFGSNMVVAVEGWSLNYKMVHMEQYVTKALITMLLVWPVNS